ncbi:hypothetical protein QT972_10970 [Microcoleus sp. herbarium7]|uniref:hypothetical protein n=1 Tax=Microcoleus sp. herbarium7 TaxID=3055435 RepID=UPI002FD1F125
MLVMQLTWELFLSAMQKYCPAFTQAGLALIWEKYEDVARTMPDQDIRIDSDCVSETFCELLLGDFAKEYSMYFSYGMQEDEFTQFKQNVKNCLNDRFVGFTHKSTVVFRR